MADLPHQALQELGAITLQRLGSREAGEKLDAEWKAAIVAALDGGVSQVAAARAAGVSRTRVQQILAEAASDPGA